MEDKTYISTKYAELHTSNRINVHIILTSGQYILMNLVVVVVVVVVVLVVVMIMMMITTVTTCNMWVFSIVNNPFCKKIPLSWLILCKHKQPANNGMYNYNYNYKFMLSKTITSYFLGMKCFKHRNISTLLYKILHLSPCIK